MSSTLDSRWATETDRKNANEGRNVSRFTVALQENRDLHPASDNQQPQHSENDWRTPPLTYNSPGRRRTNYQSYKPKVASSPITSRPWNAVVFKNKTPVERKDPSLRPSPPQLDKWACTDTQATQSIYNTSIAQSVSNSVPEQQQQQQQDPSTDTQATRSSSNTSNAQSVSSPMPEQQQRQQQQDSSLEKVSSHVQTPVSNREHNHSRDHPRQSELDDQMQNLRIESIPSNNASSMEQKALEAEESPRLNSQPENPESTTAGYEDIQQDIRREREANAARKLRAAQMREWDCGKTMGGWT
ncbi:hypothetical protein K492DRAFT_205795 [Lichtheimia hyalospora FSU 10163]|nr:hypothetical protein K492DRAFT_205795 [Lichtheimia hyalospora FSU 10163]